MLTMHTIDTNYPNSDISLKKRSRSDIFPSYKLSPSNSDVCLESRKRKRKLTGDSLNELLNDLFLLKPYPSAGSVTPRALQPLILIPRSCLPLSFLDISSSASFLGKNRLFQTYVKVLESEEELGSQPMVLVARDESSRALFALERESRGLYALCQIGLWANIQQLHDSAVASKQDHSKVFSKPASSQTLPPIRLGASTSNDTKKRQAIEAIQSMIKKPSIQAEIEPCLSKKDLESSLIGADSRLFSISKSEAPVENLSSQASMSAVFENIRKQYFDTLYFSRMSLAYFVKGPLSRARAAFHPDNDSKFKQSEYISFLQTFIIPISLMDKKYRDGVPNCLSQYDFLDQNVNNADVTKKQKKKAKNLKPGKNGLHPSEDLMIRKWWAAHNDDNNENFIVTESLKEEYTKNRISQLRTRETQLQIILLLEVLALQPSSLLVEEEATQPLSPEILNESRSSRKSNKPENLLTLIDIHVDRLCIWQSVISECHGNPSMKSQNLLKLENESEIRAGGTENILRDFSVDVILPFFSSRLPTQCASINRKLGVSVVMTGKTHPSKTKNKYAALSRPGAATKRSLAGKSCPSLKRALTDERKKRSVSQSHDKAISLMKSATMPVHLIVNRRYCENSSAPSMPRDYSHEVTLAKEMKMKRLANQKSCLTTMQSEADPEVSKNVSIEAELKDAIAALRKPNRQFTLKDSFHSPHRRASNSSHIQTSKNPPNSTPRKGRVQIFATPKTHRHQLIVDKSQNSCPQLERESPMSHSVIYPSSPLSSLSNMRENFGSKEPLSRSIQATPTRKSNSGIQIDIEETCETDGIHHSSSPLYARRSSAKLFGSVSHSSAKKSGVYEAPGGLTDTPITDKDKESSHARVSLQLQRDKLENYDGGVKNCNNIYQALGWDDELN